MEQCQRTTTQPDIWPPNQWRLSGSKTHLARTGLLERQGMLLVGQHVIATPGQPCRNPSFLPSHRNNADPRLTRCSGNLPGYRQARHGPATTHGSYHGDLLVCCSNAHTEEQTNKPACVRGQRVHALSACMQSVRASGHCARAVSARARS